MPLDDTRFRDPFEPLDKIDRVIDLLTTEDRWCQGQLETADGRRCIMGAIQAVDGADVLIHAIAIAIRQVTGRRFSWIASNSIPRFNDDYATSHALVMTVLFQAREAIASGAAGDAEHNLAPDWMAGRFSRLHRLLSGGLRNHKASGSGGMPSSLLH